MSAMIDPPHLHLIQSDPDADTQPILLSDLGLASALQPMIYLAGPYSAADQWEREENVRAAQRAADTVLSHGAIPVYTHAAYHPFHGRYSESVFIQAGLALLRPCAGLWAYAGALRSRESAGTMGELHEARRLGIPWSYDLPGLLRVLRGETN